MEYLSTKWFTAYYVSLGALLVSYGLYLLIRTETVRNYLVDAAEAEHPPVIWKRILKYLLLFTIPGLILSFIPFSWMELLFSLWCLFLIYMFGQLLVLWPQTSNAIKEKADQLPRKIRFVAANMISIGIILFLLCYALIQRMSPA